MSINIGDFVSHLMREGQYGNIANLGKTGDQPSLDLLASVNKRLAPIWGRADWKWAREPLKFPLAPGVRQYDVAAISGKFVDRIQILIPFDPTGAFLQGRPLRCRDDYDFYERIASPGNPGGTTSSCNTGNPRDYYVVDIDVNGNWTIIVDPVPTVASFMGGYAKAILTTYTMADLVANNPILYFPNGVVLDALFTGCMIDVGLLKGGTIEAAAAKEPAFEAKIKRLVSDQIGVTTDNTPQTTPLPSTVQRLRRRWHRRW